MSKLPPLLLLNLFFLPNHLDSNRRTFPNMFLPLNLLFYTLPAVIVVVQASYSSLESRSQRRSQSSSPSPRGLNTTIAGSKDTASIGSSHSTNTTQHVKLGVPSRHLVQDCSNGTISTDPVAQDCSCFAKQTAAQAIDDAITMVQAIKGVWDHTLNLPILYEFMGDCANSEDIGGELPKQLAGCKYSPQSGVLAELASTSYSWLPYDPTWLKDYNDVTSALYVYCADGVPPAGADLGLDCTQVSADYSYGWTYPASKPNYYMGFCTDNLVRQMTNTTSMLDLWRRDKGRLTVEQLGQNYGRAALNLLVQRIIPG